MADTTPSAKTSGKKPGSGRRWFWRIAIGVGVLVLLLVGAAALLIFSPRVQTWALAKFAEHLHKKTGFTYLTGPVNLDVRRHTLTLRRIRIIDLQGREMINAPYVHVTFTPGQVLKGGIRLDTATVPGATIRVVTNEALRQTNLILFADTLRNWASPPTKGIPPGSDTVHSSNPSSFTIAKAWVRNCNIIISNEGRDTLPTGIDYNHMDWRGVSGEVTGFRARCDTVELHSRRLVMHDARTGWPVRQVAAHFLYSRHGIRLTDMQVLAGQSRLKGVATARYKHVRDLGDFMKKVVVEAHIEDSRMAFLDLALFAPPVKKYQETIAIERLAAKGTVEHFRVDTFRLGFGQSRVQGRLAASGLPDAKPLRAELHLTSPHLHPQDLHPYLPASAHKHLDDLGDVAVKGSFEGTQQLFDIQADVEGKQCGRMRVKGRLDLGRSMQTATYAGTASADNFALGKLIGKKIIGKLTADVRGSGTGLVWKDAEVKLHARIEKLEVLKLPLRNWRIEADLDRHKIMQMLLGVKPGLGKEGGKR